MFLPNYPHFLDLFGHSFEFHIVLNDCKISILERNDYTLPYDRLFLEQIFSHMQSNHALEKMESLMLLGEILQHCDQYKYAYYFYDLSIQFIHQINRVSSLNNLLYNSFLGIMLLLQYYYPNNCIIITQKIMDDIGIFLTNVIPKDKITMISYKGLVYPVHLMYICYPGETSDSDAVNYHAINNDNISIKGEGRTPELAISDLKLRLETRIIDEFHLNSHPIPFPCQNDDPNYSIEFMNICREDGADVTDIGHFILTPLFD